MNKLNVISAATGQNLEQIILPLCIESLSALPYVVLINDIDEPFVKNDELIFKFNHAERQESHLYS